MGRRESQKIAFSDILSKSQKTSAIITEGIIQDENPVHLSFCRSCLIFIGLNFTNFVKLKYSYTNKNENLDFGSQLSHKDRGNIDDTTYLLHEMFGRIFFDADRKLDM